MTQVMMMGQIHWCLCLPRKGAAEMKIILKTALLSVHLTYIVSMLVTIVPAMIDGFFDMVVVLCINVWIVRARVVRGSHITPTL